jgi:hypothetical protein
MQGEIEYVVYAIDGQPIDKDKSASVSLPLAISVGGGGVGDSELIYSAKGVAHMPQLIIKYIKKVSECLASRWWDG